MTSLRLLRHHKIDAAVVWGRWPVTTDREMQSALTAVQPVSSPDVFASVHL